MKIAKFLAIATSMVVLALGTHPPAVAEASPAAASSPAMPENWDSNIPLPTGAVLVTSSVPKTGVVHAAEFSVAGNYNDLVNFYEKELPKAGFVLGPKVAFPARKVYNRNFTRGDNLDSVVVTPSTHDPSKFTVHIAWTPDAKPASKSP